MVHDDAGFLVGTNNSKHPKTKAPLIDGIYYTHRGGWLSSRIAIDFSGSGKRSTSRYLDRYEGILDALLSHRDKNRADSADADVGIIGTARCSWERRC